MKEPPKRPTVTYEQLSYSNMLTLNALVEFLATPSTHMCHLYLTFPVTHSGERVNDTKVLTKRRARGAAISDQMLFLADTGRTFWRNRHHSLAEPDPLE